MGLSLKPPNLVLRNTSKTLKSSGSLCADSAGASGQAIARGAAAEPYVPVDPETEALYLVTGAGADDSGQAAVNPFLAFVAQTHIFEQEARPTVLCCSAGTKPSVPVCLDFPFVGVCLKADSVV